MKAIKSSQTSPIPSLSISAWSWFSAKGQLSFTSRTPSLSSSSSQTSPIPSPSVSNWSKLAIFTQLSLRSKIESPSVSVTIELSTVSFEQLVIKPKTISWV